MRGFLLSKTILFTALSIVFFWQASANADYLEWNVGLRGRSTDDTFSSTKVASLRTKLKGEKYLLENLKGSAFILMRLDSGSSQSLFTNEFEPRSGIFINNATLSWSPFANLNLRGGILYQNFETPLFLDEQSFPSLQQEYVWQSEGTKVSIDAEQAIPTSNTLSRRAVGKEPTPFLYTGRARIEQILGDTEFKARATYFNFQQLTRGMAQDSRFYGNTVIGISSASEFFYNYRGWEFGGSVMQPIGNNLQLLVGGSAINNNEAPSDRNKGSYAYLGLGYIDQQIKILPRIEYYNNQSDSNPAFFSAKDFGHNNRRGIGGSLAIEIAGKVNIFARYAKTNLINQQPFQRDNFKYMELSVETSYARF